MVEPTSTITSTGLMDVEPTDLDVVSTKLRTWIKKHPGTIYYAKLIQDMLPDIPRMDDNADYRKRAEWITTTIHDRGGRFIKLNDGASGTTSPEKKEPKATGIEMDHKSSMNKVTNAIRTAHIKWLKLNGLQRSNKQKQVKQKQHHVQKHQDSSHDNDDDGNGSEGHHHHISTTTTTSPKRKRQKKHHHHHGTTEEEEGGAPGSSSSITDATGTTATRRVSLPTIRTPLEPSDMCYRVVFQDDSSNNNKTTITRQKTLTYSIQLILSICNQTSIDPVIAYRILDIPMMKNMAKNDPNKEQEQEEEKEEEKKEQEEEEEEESDKDRRIRLQLRHRYVSAMAAGISPIDFSHKLVSLWGGRLVYGPKEKTTNSRTTRIIETTVSNSSIRDIPQQPPQEQENEQETKEVEVMNVKVQDKSAMVQNTTTTTMPVSAVGLEVVSEPATTAPLKTASSVSVVSSSAVAVDDDLPQPQKESLQPPLQKEEKEVSHVVSIPNPPQANPNLFLESSAAMTESIIAPSSAPTATAPDTLVVQEILALPQQPEEDNDHPPSSTTVVASDVMTLEESSSQQLELNNT